MIEKGCCTSPLILLSGCNDENIIILRNVGKKFFCAGKQLITFRAQITIVLNQSPIKIENPCFWKC